MDLEPSYDSYQKPNAAARETSGLTVSYDLSKLSPVIEK